MADKDPLEDAVDEAIAQLERRFEELPHLRWSIVRALIHRAVHYAVDKKAGEFCALATYLADMVGHAHKIMHGDKPGAPAHKDFVH